MADGCSPVVLAPPYFLYVPRSNCRLRLAARGRALLLSRLLLLKAVAKYLLDKASKAGRGSEMEEVLGEVSSLRGGQREAGLAVKYAIPIYYKCQIRISTTRGVGASVASLCSLLSACRNECRVRTWVCMYLHGTPGGG